MHVPTDFTNPANWMHLPHAIEKPVDIFYLCHTGVVALSETTPVWTVESAKWRRGMDTGFAVQCGLFLASCNTFAPYYAQENINTIFGRTSAQIRDLYAGIPGQEAEAAFAAYIEMYNQGRPFILFGQSQGAGAMRNILFGYLKDHPDVAKRMVAAYPIGFSVTKEEIKAHPYLRAAAGADDTGVIVSFNTEAPGDAHHNGSILEGAVVINPLNWRTDDAYAPASENQGALITGGGQINILRQYADAQIVPGRSTIACSTASVEQFGLTKPLGTFHMFDVAFYYANLRENIKARIAAYLA